MGRPGKCAGAAVAVAAGARGGSGAEQDARRDPAACLRLLAGASSSSYSSSWKLSSSSSSGLSLSEESLRERFLAAARVGFLRPILTFTGVLVAELCARERVKNSSGTMKLARGSTPDREL
jgi:hypothetical protein